MSDLKLFKLAANQVTELPVSSMTLEKSLQTLIENHLDTFFKITFLAIPRSSSDISFASAVIDTPLYAFHSPNRHSTLNPKSICSATGPLGASSE